MIYTEKKTYPSTGDTLLHFVNEDSLKTDTFLKQLDGLVNNKITKKIKLHDFKGAYNEHIDVEGADAYEHIIIYGLGKSKEFTPVKIRDAMAHVTHIGQSLKSASISLFYSPIFGKEYFKIGKNLTLGYELGQYTFDKFKSKEEAKNKKKVKDIHVYFQSDIPNEFNRGVEFGGILARGVSLTRNLVNEPASHMRPETLVREAFAIEKNSKGSISVEVLDKDECERLGMGSFLGVAQGSDKEPKFIILHYGPKSRPEGDRPLVEKVKKICLVGKSITFDSGGLSLKPSKSMETMKMDMAGGATVLGIFDILSKINTTKYEVWGILPACENMPSGKALRPGDIVKALNGKTIEVLNTDAEGRLALADAVAYAEKYIKPDLIIDMATLTGACMVALGPDIAGLFGNNKVAIRQFLLHAEKEGEEVWELPLYKPYLQTLKSDIADIKNIGGTGYGGAISGALFIGEFVKKTPWLHIDIAGPAYGAHETKSIISKNATGWGVLSIISLLTS